MMMMMADGVRREMEERNLRPRLCYLTKGDRGYGFHLHGERSHGAQFIRKIEEGSPAELAGLRSGDRVVEVNGENVEKDSHQQVVQKIMEVENRTRLLVVDRETDEFLLLHSLPCTEELAVEMSCLRSPRNSSSSLVSSPQTSCSSSPRHSIARSLENSLTHSFSNSVPPSPRDSMANSLQNSVATSLCNSITLSSCDSTGSSASGSITPTRNSITPSPCEIITQLRSNSATPSSHESTPSFSRDKSVEVQMTDSMVITNGNKSPSTSVPVMNGSPIPCSDPVITSCPSDPQHECITTFSGTDIKVQVHIKEISAKQDSVTQDLRPRLCHILLGENGFGFNLHCDKRREGQYIRSVDPDSPAQRAGLLPGDRLIQVNDRSILGLRHVDVVKLIKAGGGETKLLVVDPETDTLFKKLGITPTTAHLKEDCVDGPVIESPASNRPIREENSSPTKLQSSADICPPIVHVMLTDPPITNGRMKHQSHGSSSSRSTLSEMSVELSGSDTGSKEKIFDSVCNSALGGQLEVDELKALDPLWESGLRLSPTAAEARQKVRAKRAKKSAPPMAWSKKHEIFSNF